jgi:glycosyltransferase involved in cell wall biosynthesis
MTEVASRKILLVTNWIDWAGAETQLSYLAAGLAEQGHSVALLGICEVRSDVTWLREAGVEVVGLNAVSRLAKLVAFRRIMDLARWAEVVHCTGWDASLWGRLAALLVRRPALFTEHTPGREFQVTAAGAPRGGLIALHNRLLDRFTYGAIVVGAWQRKLLEDEGVRSESIVRIPNAVPVAELRERAAQGPSRASLGIPEHSPVVLQVARFARQKGQLRTLRTVARLRDLLGEDVRALFVGDGDYEAEVKREAERSGAGDWAHFAGARDDVPGLLRLADLVVLPSSGEGLPMSLIEAIVVGTPIVATDVGDVRWLLESTGSGLCVKVADEDALTRACEQLLGDADLRAAAVEAAGQAAMRFDASEMVRCYEEVFEAAIETAPLPTFES